MKELSSTPNTPHNLSHDNQRRLAEYQLETLIHPDFLPQGESDRDKRHSIESRAYVSWISLHHHLANLKPEDLRTTFLQRKNSQHPPEPQ